MKDRVKNIIPKFILKRYYKYVNYKRYYGSNVKCPICKSEYRIFKTYGLSQRKNAECLNCGSLERHRLLWKYLNEKINFFESKKQFRMLHFAPEKIFYNIFTQVSNLQYIPCDLNPEVFKYNGNIPIEKVDITKIPYKDNAFDFILCNHVLEHIPNDKLAMSELFRVMKPNGFGIFQVPLNPLLNETYEDFSITSPEAREKAFGQKDHVRVYGLDYKEKLESVGFRVNVDDYVKSFDKDLRFKYGFMESERIYNCSK
ncbi:class I SAM-dependent methyltransferase [Hanstruepera marina]|uniref:class I SAM-dependent methyltransferase n=1 Tax=Hanstruepera marina TaxID=2873265 RepID=UPI001CA6A8E0|nr:class I SAM-dependent methyltransferase [Hanstruepera marina]